MTHYALLIGVKTSLAAGDKTMPRAVETASVLQHHLHAVGIPDQNVCLLKEPTKADDVKTEFKKLVQNATDNDTVIIAYIGHGKQASGGEPHKWLLASYESISATELATMLDHPPPGARRIVISDCCYGLGIASLPQNIRGVRRWLTVLRLMIARLREWLGRAIAWLRVDYRVLAGRVTRSLLHAFHANKSGAPLVCIAGALPNQDTDDDRERILILLTIGAVVAGSTNAELKKDFSRVSYQNTAFELEPNHASLLDEFVLGLAPAAASAAARPQVAAVRRRP